MDAIHSFTALAKLRREFALFPPPQKKTLKTFHNILCDRDEGTLKRRILFEKINNLCHLSSITLKVITLVGVEIFQVGNYLCSEVQTERDQHVHIVRHISYQVRITK